MFAISRSVPPGSMIVVLIGQKAAGVAGGLVALLAMFGPSSVLAFATARLWHRRPCRMARDVGTSLGTGVGRPHDRQRHRHRTRHRAGVAGLCGHRRHHAAAGVHPAASSSGDGCRRGADHAGRQLIRRRLHRWDRLGVRRMVCPNSGRGAASQQRTQSRDEPRRACPRYRRICHAARRLLDLRHPDTTG